MDLAIVAALLSSYHNKPLSREAIYLGEVGLTGEVRSVPLLKIRLKEIIQLKYKKLYCSTTSLSVSEETSGIEFVELKRVLEVQENL